MRQKWDAYNTYLLLRTVQAFGFTVVFTMHMLYQVAVVGLNPLQLVLVGTVLEIAALVFEIPTGVVADTYSRRLSVIIGFFVVGLGFFIEAIPTFATVLLAQLVWGLGYTFISGAADAWIVDEIGQTHAAKAFVRASQLAGFSAFIALWTSVLLGSVFLNLPHIVGGSLMLALSLLLMFIMPEEGFTRVAASERESWRDVFTTLREGTRLIRKRQILLLIVLASLSAGLFSEGWDRLWTPHLLANFNLPDPTIATETIVLFGIIRSVSALIGIAATEWLRRRDLQTHRALSSTLLLLFTGIGGGILLFANAGSLLLALLAFWLVEIGRMLAEPLEQAWINLHTDSKVRATVLSVASQSNSFGQIMGGLAIGYIGVLSGLRVAISVSSLLILPLLAVVGRARGIKHDATYTPALDVD